ncbi:hypothetical protein KSP40_PGU001515 [Platanthera guangdongensis]|uniref:Uncharacterized protein n=1 Tax=Platanthera guangdongensis TaxID=2320717 RepID=A0ABR2M4C7_9ASPA
MNISLFLQRELQNKSQRWAFAKARKKKQLYECKILHHQLKESSVNFLNAEEHHFTVDPSSLPDVLGLLTTSDNQIGLLIAEHDTGYNQRTKKNKTSFEHKKIDEAT